MKWIEGALVRKPEDEQELFGHAPGKGVTPFPGILLFKIIIITIINHFKTNKIILNTYIYID